MDLQTLPNVLDRTSRSRFPSIRVDASSLSARSGAEDETSAARRRGLGEALRQLDRLERELRDAESAARLASPTASGTASVLGGIVALDTFRPDRALGVDPADTDLIVNGSFEDTDISGGNPSVRLVDSEVAGWSGHATWQSTGNAVGGTQYVNIWRDGWGYDVGGADGNQRASLDTRWGTVDGIEQSVGTTAGQTYTLAFAYLQRYGESSYGPTDQSFEVLVDGEVIETIEPGTIERVSGEADPWQVYRVQIEAATDTTTIAFRERSSGEGYGTFIDAVSLTESAPVSGTSYVVENALETVEHTRLAEAGISAGTLTINDERIRFNPATDSLGDIIERINASDAGVSVSLQSRGTSNARGEELFRVRIESDDARMTLDDGGSGLLAALGIEAGTHGSAALDSGVTAAAQGRVNRAAAALDGLRGALASLLEESAGEARAAGAGARGGQRDGERGGIDGAFADELAALFEELDTRHGDRLDALGLRLTDAEDGYLSIEERDDRRRLVANLLAEPGALGEILLRPDGGNDNGFIAALRASVEAQLREYGPVGNIVDLYA